MTHSSNFPIHICETTKDFEKLIIFANLENQNLILVIKHEMSKDLIGRLFANIDYNQEATN